MIEAVMLWNEPNNKSHWDFELDPRWEQFARMTKLAAQAEAHYRQAAMFDSEDPKIATALAFCIFQNTDHAEASRMASWRRPQRGRSAVVNSASRC